MRLIHSRGNGMMADGYVIVIPCGQRWLLSVHFETASLTSGMGDGTKNYSKNIFFWRARRGGIARIGTRLDSYVSFLANILLLSTFLTIGV